PSSGPAPSFWRTSRARSFSPGLSVPGSARTSCQDATRPASTRPICQWTPWRRTSADAGTVAPTQSVSARRNKNRISCAPSLLAAVDRKLGVDRRLGGDRRHARHLVALRELDQPHALRVAGDGRDVVAAQADRLALLGHHHEVVLVGHELDADDRAVAVGGLDRDDAAAAAMLAAVLVELGALAVAVLTDGQQGLLAGRREGFHADDL